MFILSFEFTLTFLSSCVEYKLFQLFPVLFKHSSHKCESVCDTGCLFLTEIDRRLQQLNVGDFEDSTTTVPPDNTNVLLDELRRQEARNRRALDDLKRQMGSHSHATR